MNERKRLCRTLVACFLFGVLFALDVSASFVCEVWHENATAKTLTFGMGNEVVFIPFPPTSPSGDVFLMGRYDETGNVGGDQVGDFFQLSEDIRLETDSASWTLRSHRAATIIFKLEEGTQLPSGAILQLNGKDIAFGAKTSLDEGKDYLITYQSSSSVTPPPAQPENIRLSMVKIKGTSVSQPVGKETVLIYKGGNPQNTVIGIGNDGREYPDFGTVEIDEATSELIYTLPTNKDLSAVDAVRMFIVNENADGIQSSNAVVWIDLISTGVAVSLKSPQSIVMDGDKAQLIKYEVTAAEGVSGAISFTLRLPAWTTTTASPFPYTANVALYDDSFAQASQTLLDADSYESSFDLNVQPGQTYYLGVLLTAGSKAESGSMSLEATGTESSTSVIGPYILIEGTGTLNFDGNDTIDVIDAMLLYNFISKGGVDDPAYFETEEGKADLATFSGLSPASQEIQNAMQNFTSLGMFFDFDGNDAIDVIDAMLLYNFISKGGVDDPTYFETEEGKIDLAKFTGLPPDSQEIEKAKSIFIQFSMQ